MLCLLGQTKQCSEAFASAQAIETATDGFGIWALTATFCGLVLIATTFISHTVGAIVILPIVGAVGAEMQVGPCWRLLIGLPCTPSHASQQADSNCLSRFFAMRRSRTPNYWSWRRR